MTDLTTYHEEVGGMVEGPALFDGQEEWVKASEAADLITALEAEIARKDEALRWYRDKTQKLRLIASSFGQRHIISELEKDSGKRALAALETPHEPA